MGLYDDGGVEFAKQAFDSARERGIEQAKEAEEEGYKKSLIRGLLIEPAIGGIFGEVRNAFESRGQNLQDKNIPMRTYLQSYLSNQQGQRQSLEYNAESNPNGFIVNGNVDIQRLQNYIAADLRTRIADPSYGGEFQNLNPVQLAPYITQQSREQAEKLKDYYQNLYNESMDVPDMETILSQFDKWNSRENPKDVFGRITKGVRGLLGMETEETINFKNLEAHENLRLTLGESTAKELIDLRNAVDAYDIAATDEGSRYNIDGLIEKIRANMGKPPSEGGIQGKPIEGTFQIKDRTYVSGGDEFTYQEGQYMTYDPNGIPRLANAGVNEPTRTKVAEIKPPSDLAVKSAESAMMLVLTDGSNPEMNKLYQNVIKGKGRTATDPQNTTKNYGVKVAYAANHIRGQVKDYNLNIAEGDIDYLAAMYVLGQINEGYQDSISKNPTHDSTFQQLLMNNPNTTPDLFHLMNVAKLNTVGSNGELNLLIQIPNIIRDIRGSGQYTESEQENRFREIIIDLQATVVGEGRNFTGTALENLPEHINKFEGTNEEKVLQYELEQINQINRFFPPELRYVDPKYNGIIEKFGTTGETPEVIEEPMEVDTTTENPTPTPTPEPVEEERELTFFANTRVNKLQKAIDNIEAGKFNSYNSSEFRKFVKSKGGTLFGKNKISEERELALMKDYLQSLLDDPDNYKKPPTPPTRNRNRNK